MVFRILAQFFTNNQQIVDKLADSNVMRKVARFVVHKAIRAKSLTEDLKIENALKNLSEKLKDTKDKMDGKK